jgi:hypothetical protein
MIDAAGERSEQGHFLSQSPGSSNAVLDATPRGPEMPSSSNHAGNHREAEPSKDY